VDGSTTSLSYTTSPALNEVYGSDLRVPLVRSARQDGNRDGKMDSLELSLQTPLGIHEDAVGFSVLLFMRVKLPSKTKYIFDAVVHSSFYGGIPVSGVLIEGDLLVRQSWPLDSKGR
jgi:hypothetical protein